MTEFCGESRAAPRHLLQPGCCEHHDCMADVPARSPGDPDDGALTRSPAGGHPNSADDRDQTADDRDQISVAHDNASETRDESAEARDRRAEARDEATTRYDSGAASDRSGARRDRLGGASDRKHAADDREAAATDRALSARDRSASSVDELTGAHRRDAGLVELARETARAQRTHTPLVLAFIDVDGLKAVNDSLGHAAGDQLLRRVVNTMRTHLRSYDLIVRFGGDEFLCSLLDLSMATAAERFVLINADLAAEPRASITAGLAQLGAHDSPEDLMARADAALRNERRQRPSARARPSTIDLAREEHALITPLAADRSVESAVRRER